MQKINLNLLKYKNPSTNQFEHLHTFAGKSAYEYAQEGGYKGTEQEFIMLMATIASLKARIAALEASTATIPSTNEDGTLIF